MQTEQDRPLSPHVTIYAWPLNAVLSILHRMTGSVLLVGAVLVVCWLMAASISKPLFDCVNALMTSIPGDIVMLGLLAALCFHFVNGIRHLVWDAGAGFDSRTVRLTAIAGLCSAAVLFVCALVATGGLFV